MGKSDLYRQKYIEYKAKRMEQDKKIKMQNPNQLSLFDDEEMDGVMNEE